MIELQKITKIFQRKSGFITALSNVSLTVPRGSIFGVIGASGAGKSTLIRCVNLLERPTSGEVIINGQRLSSLPVSVLSRERRKIGMIFQHFNLLSSATVFENVALPLKLQKFPGKDISSRVDDLLRLVGLYDKRQDYPARLSGGQKQRVAIARALASDPTVLLCDEATSALDPGTTQSILTLLKDINRRLRITILLITHEMDVVKTICDSVAVMHNGEIIEQGPVSVIFATPQQQLTKEFINSSINTDLPAGYRASLKTAASGNDTPVVKIEFRGDIAHTSLLSEIAVTYRIKIRIVTAKIDSVENATFGIMIVEMNGRPADTADAIDFLNQNNVHIEILGYV